MLWIKLRCCCVGCVAARGGMVDFVMQEEGSKVGRTIVSLLRCCSVTETRTYFQTLNFAQQTPANAGQRSRRSVRVMLQRALLANVFVLIQAQILFQLLVGTPPEQHLIICIRIKVPRMAQLSCLNNAKATVGEAQQSVGQ